MTRRATEGPACQW